MPVCRHLVYNEWNKESLNLKLDECVLFIYQTNISKPSKTDCPIVNKIKNANCTHIYLTQPYFPRQQTQTLNFTALFVWGQQCAKLNFKSLTNIRIPARRSKLEVKSLARFPSRSFLRNINEREAPGGRLKWIFCRHIAVSRRDRGLTAEMAE